MLCGLVIKRVVSWIGVGSAYVDRGVATRIGGTVTDWLVAFGVASIQLGVVAEHIWPILAMCVVGWLLALGFLFFLAPRMNPVFWFERGIFAFGWTTGVVAMGIALLRVADPNYRSGTLEAYGLAYTIIAPVELVLVATVPIFVGMGYLWATTGVLLAIFLVPIVLSVVFRFWSNSYPFWDQREGEEEVIAGLGD
jgi:ESS family glutamate:Na+ symporter